MKSKWVQTIAEVGEAAGRREAGRIIPGEDFKRKRILVKSSPPTNLNLTIHSTVKIKEQVGLIVVDMPGTKKVQKRSRKLCKKDSRDYNESFY